MSTYGVFSGPYFHVLSKSSIDKLCSGISIYFSTHRQTDLFYLKVERRIYNSVSVSKKLRIWIFFEQCGGWGVFNQLSTKCRAQLASASCLEH